MEIKSYRDLKVWQAAISIAEAIYLATAEFPKTETYGLVTQMRRAAVSIAANIAEGHGRETSGAFVQFLRIAQGSLKEIETHVILAKRFDFLTADGAEKLLRDCDELGRMTRALIRSIQDRAQSDA